MMVWNILEATNSEQTKDHTGTIEIHGFQSKTLGIPHHPCQLASHHQYQHIGGMM
jgi:hypothetical protein